MGIFDKIKDTAGEDQDRIDAGLDTVLDKGGALADDRTGATFAGDVEQDRPPAKEDDLGRLLDRERAEGEAAEPSPRAADTPGTTPERS